MFIKLMPMTNLPEKRIDYDDKADNDDEDNRIIY